MIFKTVNSTLEKTAYNIDIKNIDLAPEHWGSEKQIFSFLDEIENFMYNKETFDKNLILHSIKLLKNNIRVEDAKFYRIPEENKLILAVFTAVSNFKNFDSFSREMSISFKREKFSFSIIEIIKEETKKIKTGELIIPETWKLDEKLTDRMIKLKEYV